MKISRKVTMISVAITTAGIILCCAILLITTSRNHVSGAVDSGIAELKMLCSSFHAEMDVAVSDNSMSETAKTASLSTYSGNTRVFRSVVHTIF